MSEIVYNLAHKILNDADKNPTPRQSRQNTHNSVDNEVIISSLTGYERDLGEKLEQLEHEAEKKLQEIELSECLTSVAQLVDLFKNNIIADVLQNQNDWHSDNQQHKYITGNTLFDNKIEKIVIQKGLTKEQWSCLLFVSLSAGDAVEIPKISKKYLKNMHHKASRLLEDNERNATFALIDAIDKYMLEDHPVDK